MQFPLRGVMSLVSTAVAPAALVSCPEVLGVGPVHALGEVLVCTLTMHPQILKWVLA